MWWTVMLMAAGAAAAEPAGETCRAVAPPPAELVGWASRASVKSPDTIEVGRAVDLALGPIADAPSRSYGGHVLFSVTRAGRYRVALGGAAWIDVWRGSAFLTSVGHSHGPPCTGIRKMVDFMLAPGRYGLLIKDSAAPTVALMVARVP